MKRINIQIPFVVMVLFFASSSLAAGGIGGSGAPASKSQQMEQGTEREHYFEIEKARVKVTPEENDGTEDDSAMNQERTIEQEHKKDQGRE